MPIINVDKYVDIYIHYHSSRVQPMADDADLIFSPLRNSILDDIRNSGMTLQARVNMMNNKDHHGAAQALEFANELANGTLLQDTLESIARSLNNAIDTQLTIDTYYKEALTFANLLENGSPELRTVKNFLNLLVRALDARDAYNKTALNIFIGFIADVTGKNKRQFRFTPGILLSDNELPGIRKIEEYLDTAVNSFNKNGYVSANSFRQTIANIFTRQLGASIARTIVTKVDVSKEKQIDRILRSINSTNVKFLNSNVSLAKTATSSNIERVGVLNTKGMSIDVISGDKTITVEVGSDFNFKALPTIEKDRLQIVAESTIGLVNLSEDIADTNVAYNIFTHKHQFLTAYTELSTTIAASFLKNSVLTANQDEINQFLLINGKFYPVLSIISNICEKTLRRGAIPHQMIQIEGLKPKTNTWLGREKNWKTAEKRSKLVKQVIDELKIGLYFNSNILAQYLPY